MAYGHGGRRKMKFEYCDNCGRNSGFKRNLGIGTLLMVLLTGGLWLLVIPFYPLRCINCGQKYGESFN